MLRNRHALLSPDPNVADAVADLEAAVREFRREAPVSQVLDVAAALKTTEPGASRSTVAGTVLAELASLREAVPAGPTERGDADVVVGDATDQSVSATADVSGETDVTVTVRSHTDAVRFAAKRDDTITTTDTGRFDASFDFDDVPPGTEFTVVVERRGTPAVTAADLVEDLLDEVEHLDRSERYALLVLLAASGRYSPPHWMQRIQEFTELVDAVEDELSQTGDRETILRRRLELLEDLVEYVDHTGLPQPFDALDPDDWLHLYEDLSVDATTRALALLGQEDIVERYRQGVQADAPVYVGLGRVLPDDPERDAAGAVADAIAETTYLPALLWLDRVAPAFDPDGEDPAATLEKRRTKETPFGTIDDERAAMQTMLHVLGYRRPNPAVFENADVDAVRDLVELRTLDLASLLEALRAVTRPLRWTGVDELVSLTGDRDRPDAQSVWHVTDPVVDAEVDKHSIGEARTRLERLHEHPVYAVEPKLAGYSPPIRWLLSNGRIDEEPLEYLERFVADPVGLLETFGDVAPDLPALLADVHDLLHHVDATSKSTVEGLAARIESFRNAVDAENRLDEFAAFVEDPGELLDVVRTVDDRLATAVDQHPQIPNPEAPDPNPYSDVRDHFRGEFTKSRDGFEAKARAELENRILPVTKRPDVTESFRSGVLETVRHVLMRASYFGIYGSVPAVAAGGAETDEDALVSQIERVRTEVTKRMDAAKRFQPDDSPPDVDAQVNRLQALLGDEFVVCPPFAPANATELHNTLNDGGLLDDDYETDTWLQRAARVRDLPKDFRQLRTYADALDVATGGTGTLRRTLEVGQLPHVPGQDWLGRDGVEPTGGELSLAIEFANEAPGNGPVATAPGSGSSLPPLAGLLVDEWVERTPASEETVGLGLQYDDPSARAPQSILLAVPPTWESDREMMDEEMQHLQTLDAGPSAWTDALFERTITETFDQMDARSVDLDAFERYGHLLPMLYFAYNRDTTLWGEDITDAPSVDFNEFDWRGLFQ